MPTYVCSIAEGSAAAPAAGIFRLYNVFGTPTLALVRVSHGERLPGAPIGFTWRLEADTNASSNVGKD